MRDKETKNKQARENAVYKKSVFRCVRCGQQDAFTLNGRSYCADCAEYDRECKRNVDYSKRKEQYYYRKENRLCVHCGKPLPENHTKANCTKCLQTAKNRAERRRRQKGVPTWQYRLDSGLCFFCMKEKVIPGKKTCSTCHDIMTDRLMLYKRDNGGHVWRELNSQIRNLSNQSVE